MTSGGRLEAWLIAPSTAVYWKCHASRRPPDVILRRSFTRLSTVLAVILLRKMTSGGRLEAWLIAPSTAVYRKYHASRRPPDVILRRSFTTLSIALAVIERLGTRG